MEGLQVQPRERKPVVTRFARFNEAKDSTGKFTRIVTICYTYDRQNQTLKYGATIYRATNDRKDVFNRKKHNTTASERMKNNPVVIDGFEDTKTLPEFHNNMRNLLYKNKVRAKTYTLSEL
jgi:hypothetical protein